MSRSFNETSIPHMLGCRADGWKTKRRSVKRARRSDESNSTVLRRIQKHFHSPKRGMNPFHLLLIAKEEG